VAVCRGWRDDLVFEWHGQPNTEVDRQIPAEDLHAVLPARWQPIRFLMENEAECLATIEALVGVLQVVLEDARSVTESIPVAGISV